MVDVARVVEIRGTSEGSGFLIGPGLVLTAWHVLRPAVGEPFPKQVEVRILRDYLRAAPADRLKTQPAKILWPHDASDESHDFALLQVADTPSVSEESPLKWADLPEWDEIEVQVVGFPDFGIFTNSATSAQETFSERDTVSVRGRVPAASGWKQRHVYAQGSFDVVLREEDLPDDSHIRWEGMSGAAVFAEQNLVGVVRAAAESRSGLHRLRALPVARLFARDDVRAALRDAGADLPPSGVLASGGRTRSGFMSDLLDRFGVARDAPSQFRAGVELFLSNYLPKSGQRMVFGGRDPMLQRLDRWLDDPAASPRLLLHAPGGRGKSALVVNWLLEAGGRCRPMFLPVSVRGETNLPRLFYHALSARLAELLDVQLPPPIADDPVGHYRGFATDFLRRLDANGKPVLLVVDGLDEAAGWSLPPTLLPQLPHPGLRVLISARERTGDRGGQGWLERLGWDRDTPPEVIEVDPLDAGGVAQVLRSVDASFADAENAEVAAQIVRLSGGDPWIVRLYAEDLCGTDGGGPGRLRSKDLATLQRGFGPFFRDWLDDQRKIWRLRERPVDDAALDVVLALLARALGPLRHADLAELYRCWRGAEFTLAREALEPIDRFVLGDGDQSGYVLAHPKFADFLRDEHFADPAVPRRARQAFLHYGLDTLTALSNGTLAPKACPTYLVTYLGQHLADAAAPVEEFMRLVEHGWLRAWHAFEGGYRGFSQDVRRAADAIEERASKDERRWVWRLRCCLATSSIASIGSQVPGQLIVECVATGRLTGRQALYWLEQQGRSEKSGVSLEEITSRSNQVKALVALVQAWPPGNDRAQGLAEILRVASSIGSEWARADALKGLAACVPDPLLGDTLRAALSLSPDEKRAEVLAVLVLRIPETLRAEALQAVLATTTRDKRSKTVEILAQSLSADLLKATLELSVAEAEASHGPAARAWMAITAAAHYPEAAGEVIEASVAVKDEKVRRDLLVAVAPHLPEPLLPAAFEAALTIGDESLRLSTITALAPRLSGTWLAEAARHARLCKPPYGRALALTAIAARAQDAEERALLFTEAVRAVDAVQNDTSMLWLLRKLAACAPDESGREAILARALRAIETIGGEYERAGELAVVAPQLSSTLAKEALRLVKAINDELARSRALTGIAQFVPEPLIPAAFGVANDIKGVVLRGEAIAALALKLPEPLLPQALEAASAIADKGGHPALFALVRRLPASLLGSALAAALSIPNDDARHHGVGLVVDGMSNEMLEYVLQVLANEIDSNPFRPGIVDFARHVPDPLLPQVLRVLENAKSETARADVLVALATRLTGPLLGDALRLADAIRRDDLRAKAHAAIGPRLPGETDREKALADALQAAGKTAFESSRAEVIETLWPLLPADMMSEALELIAGIEDDKLRAHLLVGADRLPKHLVRRAQQIAQAIAGPRARAEALTAVARQFATDTERADALEEALRAFMTVGDDDVRAGVLAALVPRLAEGPARVGAFDEAMRLASSLHDRKARVLALGRLAAHRPEALRAVIEATNSSAWDDTAEVLAECLPASEHSNLLRAVSAISDERNRVRALLALVKMLPQAARGEFLRLGLAVTDEAQRANFIRDAAPHFGPALIRLALRTAKRMKSDFQRKWAMQGLEPYRPRSWFVNLLQDSKVQAEAEVEASLRKAETLNDLYRARALIDLAPSLPERLAADALRICASIGHEVWRASALAKLVRYLPEPKRADALRVATEIDFSHARGTAIAGVAAHLPKPMLPDALSAIEAIDDWWGFTEGMTGLAPRLDDTPLLRRALASASAHLTGGELRVRALAALGPQLPPGAEREAVLLDALRAAEAIKGPVDRVKALRLLLPHLAVELRERAIGALVHTAGGVPRINLLETIPELVAAVEGFQDDRSLLAVYHAVRDVGDWFP
jgi:hypothetical protein